MDASSVAELNNMPVEIDVPPELPTGTDNVEGHSSYVPRPTTELVVVNVVETAIPMLLAGTPVGRIADVADEGIVISLPHRDTVDLLPIDLTEPIYVVTPPAAGDPAVVVAVNRRGPTETSTNMEVPGAEDTTETIDTAVSTLALPRVGVTAMVVGVVDIVIVLWGALVFLGVVRECLLFLTFLASMVLVFLGL